MTAVWNLSRVALVSTILFAGVLPANAVEVLSGPTLTMDPTGLTPLSGVVELETDVPVLAELTITDGIDLWTVSFPDAHQVHYLPVLGLKPDRTYDVDVELTPGGLVGQLMATTDPLPADFPVVMTTLSDPQAMEPGLTLLDCFGRANTDARPRYAMVVDSAGEVVWYSTLCAAAFRMLPNGKLFYRSGTSVRERDMLGRLQLDVAMADPGTGLHHDLLRTPMGTYLSLSRESVEVMDFPTSATDPDAPTQTVIIEDDPVVEFLPDGSLRNEWFLTEMLDPIRIGFQSLNSRPEGLDWAHANAVTYDPSDDSILVSVGDQAATVKFSR